MRTSYRLIQKLLEALGYRTVRVGAGVVLLQRGEAATATYDPIPLGPDTLLASRNTEHWERQRALSSFLLGRHLVFLFARLAVNCVLDVGANAGQYATALRGAGYGGHIVSFEPIPELYAALREAARSDPRWTVHPFALGRADGVVPIRITQNTVFSSFLPLSAYAAEQFGPEVEVARVEQVQVRRLDSVLDEVIAHVPEPRLFLKIDTQGHDLEVFAGLGPAVEKLAGLQSELSLAPLYEGMPAMSEALRAYHAHGFAIAGFFPVVTDPATLRLIELDCVMVRLTAL